MLQRRYSTLLCKIYGGPVRKNTGVRTRTRPDLGVQQPYERGTDAFDPKHMRSRNLNNQLRSASSIQREQARSVRADEINSTLGGESGAGAAERARQLSLFDSPRNENEQRFVDAEFEREMQLRPSQSTSEQRRQSGRARLPSGLNLPTGPEVLVRHRPTHSGTAPAGQDTQNHPLLDTPYTTRMHDSRVGREAAQLRARFKYALKPTAKEYNSALHKLNIDSAMDEQVDRLQERLIEENGLYPSQRLDAYMLRDETMFPQWVSDLPPHVRDRVRYGGIGLTEDDEVLRQNLARMPHDERAAEWARLKAAREHKQGTAEQRISPAEQRQLRLGIRRHHALHHRRLRRATLLKQLTLRTPEKFEVWPTRDVDYSARLSQVAQFVEAGVPTMGEWPLDIRKLANARRKKLVAEEAEKQFVAAGVSNAAHPTADRIGQGMKDVLRRIEEKQRDVKHISKRWFARRFTAVKMGDRDEHGRPYKHMTQWVRTRRRSAIASDEEMRLEHQALPSVYAHEGKAKATHASDRLWQGHNAYAEEARAFGIPLRKNTGV